MTWVWGLGPELLQVKRRLPAGRWGPVFRLTDPGKRRWVSSLQPGLSPLRLTVSKCSDEVEAEGYGLPCDDSTT